MDNDNNSVKKKKKSQSSNLADFLECKNASKYIKYTLAVSKNIWKDV